MKIRLVKEEDMASVLTIYAQARHFMRMHGNLNQWINNYPNQDILEKDIKNKNCYIAEQDQKIAGVFTFILGEDPTYQKIEGRWHYNRPYGTIHRMASSGLHPNISEFCFQYCSSVISYLRIDTHEDNHIMQNAVSRFGFQKCGIIYLSDGSPRIAYDYLKTEK